MCDTKCSHKVSNVITIFCCHLLRILIMKTICSTLESDKAVEDVLASKGKQKTELITKMLEDEKYQREAFQALLLQQDHRALEIGEQMSRIQNELASLTSVEMQKRDMKVQEFHTKTGISSISRF